MPPDSPVDAGSIPHRQFSTARRGLDSGEVRAYLHHLAELVASLQQQEAEVLRRAQAAEARVARMEKPDRHLLVELLGEETARVLDTARQAAGDIRQKSEEAASRLIREANDQARERRAEAEAESLAYRAELLAEVEELRQEAATELDNRKVEADEMVAEMRREAQVAADSLRQEGERERDVALAEAATIREAGREEARRLIAEARTMRERVLGDLGRRRRSAREQLERLSAARDRLLAAYEVVRRTVDEATAELRIALPEAKVASDTASRRVLREPELTADDMESQVFMARVAGLLPPLPDDIESLDALIDPQPEGSSGLPELPEQVEVPELPEASEPADALPEAGLFDVTGEPEPVGEPALSADVAEPEPEPEAVADQEGEAPETGPEPEREPELLAEPVADSEDASGGESGGDDKQNAKVFTASVDDVFARLKRGTSPGVAPDQVLLRQRDETLEPLERTLSRRLKRVLADEQNEVLDLVRQGVANPEDLLPEAEAHAARYGDAAADELHTAAYWGAAAVEGQPRSGCDELADDLGHTVTAPLRERVATAVAEVDGDPSELMDRLRALYREWKNQWLGQTVRHMTAAAYVQGAYEALPPGSLIRWVVDTSGPCPDAEDNALAGAVRKGDRFPTGHCLPPAHSGCRCSIVPIAVGLSQQSESEVQVNGNGAGTRKAAALTGALDRSSHL